jgi:hypothetical protein
MRAVMSHRRVLVARLIPVDRPVAPSSRVAARVRAYCRRITSAAPQNAASDDARWRLEHLLMRVLHTAGLRGVEQMMRGAGVPGLEPVEHVAGMRRWIAAVPEHHAELWVSVSSNRHFKSISVVWSALPQPPRTKRQRERKQLQDRFYARYLAAGARAYAVPPLRLSKADSRILLVGELEADVNNGGFSQYLANKGRRRAAAALRALERTGAVKTAALLRAAMASASDEAELQRLDARFERTREDLAVLAMAGRVGP